MSCKPLMGGDGEVSPHQSPTATASVSASRAAYGGYASTRACGRSPSGEGIFYWFSPAATTAASAMELTFVWKESLRLVRMAGTLVPVRMQPFLQSAVWTSVL